MTKVLVLSTEYPPRCGGAGRVAEDTVTFLSKNGFDVTVLTFENKEVRELYNVKYYYIKYIPSIFPLLFWLKIKKEISCYKTIILNDIGAALTAAEFFNENLIRRCLMYIHGGEIDRILDNPKKVFKLVNFRDKYIKMLHICKKVICVSEFMKKQIMKRTLQDSIESILVVHSGVDNELFFYDKIDLRADYHLKRDSILICTASRIVAGKGYPEMLEIFRELHLYDDRYVWFVAGDGNYKEQFKKQINEFGLSDYIIFTGNLSPDRLRQLYSSSDVFMLLSKYQEAYGLVYLEAIKCGLPVIARDIGGVKEAVEPGINGYLVKNEEECLQHLKNRDYEFFDKETIISSAPDYTDEKMELLHILY